MSNNHLVLVGGKSGTGKSMSLMNLQKPEGVMYLNTEANKKLPFKSKFMELNVVDPLQIYEAFEKAEEMDHIHTIVVDTLTYLMDMYETKYVLTSSNTMKAWGEYAQYFKKLMQQYVANSTKNVIFLAHTADVVNESEMITEVLVKVKGSLMNQGIESYFSTVISTKKIKLKELGDMKSDLLNISDQESILGFKHCFQTLLTKATVNDRIRAPLGMWKVEETYIDNDLQQVINRLHEYYD